MPALMHGGKNYSGGGGASTLDELYDVEITTPTNGQVLKYDSANSKWVNDDDEGCLFTVVNGKVCITYEE